MISPFNLCKNIFIQLSKVFFNCVYAPGFFCICSSFFYENSLQFSAWISFLCLPSLSLSPSLHKFSFPVPIHIG